MEKVSWLGWRKHVDVLLPIWSVLCVKKSSELQWTLRTFSFCLLLIYSSSGIHYLVDSIPVVISMSIIIFIVISMVMSMMKSW